MEKLIKFSTFKARILLMIGPTMFIIPMILAMFPFVYILKMGSGGLVTWLFVMGFPVLIVYLIYLILSNQLLLSRNIRELRENYPVLEQNWYDLNYADYLDEDLQLLIYGDYLICYRTFDIAYLPDCRKIRVFKRSGGAPRGQNVIHFRAIYNDGRYSEIRTNILRVFWRIDQMYCKEILYDYIKENYEHIEFQE